MAKEKDEEQAPENPVAIHYGILAEAIGYRLRRAHLAILQEFHDAFAETGISALEFSTLLLVSQNPGLKQSDIAAALGIQRANFVLLVDTLTRRGFAERQKSGRDRRVQSLYLTDAGQAFLVEMMQIWRVLEDRMIERLGGPEARDQLIGLLSRFCAGDALKALA